MSTCIGKTIVTGNLGVPKLELLTCLCKPDRAKQSPTLRGIASAEEHRLATTSSSIISDLGTPGNLLVSVIIYIEVKYPPCLTN